MLGAEISSNPSMPWNTDTQPTDLERIRRVLKVPAEKMYLEVIRNSMNRVERESPDSIATAQEILDLLDGNRSTTRAVRADASYALVRADVLEWSDGQRDSGLTLDKSELIEELTMILHIELPEHNSYGSLGRS